MAAGRRVLVKQFDEPVQRGGNLRPGEAVPRRVVPADFKPLRLQVEQPAEMIGILAGLARADALAGIAANDPHRFRRAETLSASNEYTGATFSVVTWSVSSNTVNANCLPSGQVILLGVIVILKQLLNAPAKRWHVQPLNLSQVILIADGLEKLRRQADPPEADVGQV